MPSDLPQLRQEVAEQDSNSSSHSEHITLTSPHARLLWGPDKVVLGVIASLLHLGLFNRMLSCPWVCITLQPEPAAHVVPWSSRMLSVCAHLFHHLQWSQPKDCCWKPQGPVCTQHLCDKDGSPKESWKTVVLAKPPLGTSWQWNGLPSSEAWANPQFRVSAQGHSAEINVYHLLPRIHKLGGVPMAGFSADISGVGRNSHGAQQSSKIWAAVDSSNQEAQVPTRVLSLKVLCKTVGSRCIFKDGRSCLTGNASGAPTGSHLHSPLWDCLWGVCGEVCSLLPVSGHGVQTLIL